MIEASEIKKEAETIKEEVTILPISITYNDSDTLAHPNVSVFCVYLLNHSTFLLLVVFVQIQNVRLLKSESLSKKRMHN